MTAILFLANSGLDPSQSFSVLAAASPKSSELTRKAKNGEFIKLTTYESVDSIIRQCENQAS